MKINNIATWFKKCTSAAFGIKLPSGWFGRPFDNQHRPEDYKIDKDKIWLKFDEVRSLTIYDYSCVDFLEDNMGNHLLKFKSYSSIEFLSFPYDKTISEKSIKVFKDGELVLYGFFFK